MNDRDDRMAEAGRARALAAQLRSGCAGIEAQLLAAHALDRLADLAERNHIPEPSAN